MGHTSYVVLPARGRRAQIGQCPVVVTVSLGFARPGFAGLVTRHPEVQFAALLADGTTSAMGVVMTFQTHAVGTSANDGDRRGPGGFLRMGSGEWVGCYGAEIRANLEYPCHETRLARVVALVGRARDRAPRIARQDSCIRRTGCDLLALLTGLQRCGVEVRVYHEAGRQSRASRAA